MKPEDYLIFIICPIIIFIITFIYNLISPYNKNRKLYKRIIRGFFLGIMLGCPGVSLVISFCIIIIIFCLPLGKLFDWLEI